MTGSIQKKNGKYYLVISYCENNNRKLKWIPTELPVKNNKRKAQALLAEFLLNNDDSIFNPTEQEKPETKIDNTIIEPQFTEQMDNDYLFTDFIRIWLDRIKHSVDEVSYQGYRLMSERHIIPYFEKTGLKLSEIKRCHIQQFVNDKFEHGRCNGKGGLSPNSINKFKCVINQVLTEAVIDEIIEYNPCQHIKMPQAERFEGSYYSLNQLDALFEVAKDEPIYPIIRITALYGLRRSEVLGLKWDSLNFENNTVTIKHTVVKVVDVIEKDKTKNNSSRRTFPMTEDSRQLFLELKKSEEENRKKFKSAYHENDYVFKWPDGTPFPPDYITHRFAKILKQNNLPYIRFHDLRHSCASLLLSMGFSMKEIQAWLGHSDIKVTMNTYAHLDSSVKLKIADTLASNLTQNVPI